MDRVVGALVAVVLVGLGIYWLDGDLWRMLTGVQALKQEGRPVVDTLPPPPVASAPAPRNGHPPAAANGGRGAPPPAAANGGGLRPTVLQTVYDWLPAPGREAPDNALYSYALFPQASPRAEAFLAALLESTGDAASATVAPKRLNVLYLPAQEAKLPAFVAPRPRESAAELARAAARELYDYARARSLLAGMCAEASRPLARFCAAEPARGPYVASFRVAVSQRLSQGAGAPVPVLMLDLSDVHEGAFATIIGKYKDQVRRPDLPEPETINSLREKLLSITLEAADLIVPVRKAIAEMIETADAADSGAGKK